MTSTEKGRAGELKAAEYLQEKGFRILEKNFRTHGTEVDIVCNNDTTIVFCEVKAWRYLGRESLEKAVDQRKLRKLRIAAGIFLRDRPEFQGHAVRLDLVFISPDHAPLHLENVTS